MSYMSPRERLMLKKYDLEIVHDELDNLDPLSYAAKHGVIEFIEATLLNLSPEKLKLIINQANVYGLSALHFACRYGQIEIVTLLRAYGALSQPTKSLGLFPVHMIFRDQNDEAKSSALLLLFPTKDISEKTFLNESVAHMAASKNFVSILQILKGIDPHLLNGKDNFSMTPLLTAVTHNQIEAAKYLLEASDFNQKNSKSQNALHIAAKSSNTKMFELLLPYFDVALLDGEGNTALDLVKATQQKEKENLMNQFSYIATQHLPPM